MPLTRKAAALSLGLSAILTAATIAQVPKPGQADETLAVEDAQVDWFQVSDVSALREGIIDTIELRVGKEVKAGGEIGRLHKKVADLAVEEAKIQAEGQGAIMKAKAQKALAAEVVRRNMSLAKKGPNFISVEEVQKGEAEYAVADASLIEAQDTQKLANAKLNSAKQAADEHIIKAPFSGTILREYKHEGESVGAREPVVKLGNLDTVRVWAYIPVEYAYRVTPGTEIQVQPRLGGASSGKHRIEQKKFRGVITAVNKEIQPVAETAVQISADIDNPNHELRPGLKARLIIMLKPDEGAAVASPGSADQASSVPTGVGARQVELPPLPR